MKKLKRISISIPDLYLIEKSPKNPKWNPLKNKKQRKK